MWEQLKIKHPSVIMYVGYEDFATIEVEKKVSPSSNIVHYMINIEIIDVTSQCVDVYKLTDIEKMMRTIRKEIEQLYEDIPLLSQEQIDDWIDDFIDILNSF
ncbi:MAG: hypothetical protein PUA56_02205 [Bacillales bacterium]|nr:hypothetical protein [Bacillales bacterium]